MGSRPLSWRLDDFVSVWRCWSLAIRHLSTGNAPDIRGRVGRRFLRSVRAPAHSLLHSVVHADSPHPSAACGVWRPRDVRVREGVGNSCVARGARRRGRRWRGKPRQFGVGGPAGPEAHRFHVEPHRLRQAAKAGVGQWLPPTAFHIHPALARPVPRGQARIGIGEAQATDSGAGGRTSGASSAQFFPQGQDGRRAELCIDSPGKSCDLARVSGRRPLQFSTKFSTRNRRRCLAHPCRATCVVQRGEPSVLHRLVHGLGQQGRFLGGKGWGASLARRSATREFSTCLSTRNLGGLPPRMAVRGWLFWGQLCGEIASTIRRRPLGQGWSCEEEERRFPRFPYDATAGVTAFSELGAGPRPWTRSRLRVERLWVHLWISGQLQEPIPDYLLESRVALVLALWGGSPLERGPKGIYSSRIAVSARARPAGF